MTLELFRTKLGNLPLNLALPIQELLENYTQLRGKNPWAIYTDGWNRTDSTRKSITGQILEVLLIQAEMLSRTCAAVE